METPIRAHYHPGEHSTAASAYASHVLGGLTLLERQVQEESLESPASVLPATPALVTPSTATQIPKTRS
ncbi:hypothetical protein FB157_14911 [Streptomyces sp. BK340]|nr:hypothetical protein FB157_14911 [Streptomyces sp. BK340]